MQDACEPESNGEEPLMNQWTLVMMAGRRLSADVDNQDGAVLVEIRFERTETGSTSDENWARRFST
jgi:hypothetical protein